jgi:hypothetical protein
MVLSVFLRHAENLDEESGYADELLSSYDAIDDLNEN